MNQRNFKIFFLLIFAVSSFRVVFLQANETEASFTRIYKSGVWGKNQDGEGSSGGGSTVEATAEYRRFLQKFLIDQKIQSVIDVGCGDWEFSQLIDWGNIQYTGYDIVSFVIEKNRKRFEKSTISFEHKNAIETDLPKADLLICKEVLQHLSNKDIKQFLNQIHKFKYCLITNDVNPSTLSSDNRDIENGDYRHLDLTKAPFFINGIPVLTYQVPYGFYEVKQVLLIINPENFK
jgi:SAM-dependent methyltransferase